MIEIVVNGYTLPLPKGFRLNREVETQIFNKEMSAYDFSYPVEIPLADEARVALGFPDVIAISEHKARYQGKLIIDSIFVSGVTIAVLGVNLKSSTCRISVLGSYRSLRDVFGSKKVNELMMGGDELIERHIEPGFDPYEYHFTEPSLDIKDGIYNYDKLKIIYHSGKVNCFMRAVAKGLIERNYLFPKAVDLKGDLPGNAGGVSVINAYDYDRDRYVDADFYNAMASQWEYMPDVSPSNPFANNQRHFWVPMFKLVKVLSAIFSEQGIAVEGDFLSDPKAQNIVLYNTHAINTGVQGSLYFDIPTGTWLCTLNAGSAVAIVRPKNHLPQMEIIDFLYELGKRYNLQFEYDALANTVHIRQDRKLWNAPAQTIDLTQFASPKPSIKRKLEDSFINGYRFSFADDPADDASTDKKNDAATGYRFRGAINYTSDIGTITSVLVDDVVYIKSLDSYWRYFENGGWQHYAYNIIDHSTSSSGNLESIETKILSCPTRMEDVRMIEYFSGYARVLNIVGNYYTNESEAVPFSKIGISYDFYAYIDWESDNGIVYAPGVGHPWQPHFFQTTKAPISHLPHLVTCVGFKKGGIGLSGTGPSEKEYYMATSGPYDSRGSLIGAYTGSWSSPEGYGLYKDWWQAFVEFVQNSIVVEYEVLLDAALYSKLDISTTRFKIDGIFYLCKKANFVMPFPEVSVMEMVKGL